MTSARIQRTLWILAVVTAFAITACGREQAREEEHEGEPKTGAHGGALVELSAEAIRTSGIEVDTSGQRSIAVVVELPGEIKLDAERSVEIRPSYPGAWSSSMPGSFTSACCGDRRTCTPSFAPATFVAMTGAASLDS